jgi:hypothetical protein
MARIHPESVPILQLGVLRAQSQLLKPVAEGLSNMHVHV